MDLFCRSILLQLYDEFDDIASLSTNYFFYEFYTHIDVDIVYLNRVRFTIYRRSVTQFHLSIHYSLHTLTVE